MSVFLTLGESKTIDHHVTAVTQKSTIRLDSPTDT